MNTAFEGKFGTSKYEDEVCQGVKALPLEGGHKEGVTPRPARRTSTLAGKADCGKKINSRRKRDKIPNDELSRTNILTLKGKDIRNQCANPTFPLVVQFEQSHGTTKVSLSPNDKTLKDTGRRRLGE